MLLIGRGNGERRLGLEQDPELVGPSPVAVALVKASGVVGDVRILSADVSECLMLRYFSADKSAP